MKRLLDRRVLFSIIVLVLFLSPLFHKGIYSTQDGEAQIARFAAYYNAFSDLQIPPRWAGYLNFGYGTPIFIFYYPLPGYLSSLLHLLGISFENSFKMLLGASVFLSFFSFYLWSLKIFKKNTAFLSSILYAIIPYHLLNLYVRGDVAESIALAIVPLVFFSIEEFFDEKKIVYVLSGGIFYGLLILSHNGISLIFTPVLLLYCLFKSKDKKLLLLSLSIFLIGLSFSALFWMPAIFEGKFVNTYFFTANIYKNNFLNLSKIFYSSWGFGSDVNQKGGLSPQIGIPYLLVVAFMIFDFFRKRMSNRFIFFWIFTFLIFTFMTTSLSVFFWEKIALIRFLEFPWRFVAVSSFSAVVLVSYLLDKIKNRRILGLVFTIIVIYCAFFIKTQTYNSKPDNFYKSYTYTTYFHGEASSIWTAGDFGKKAGSQFEIISGDAKIIDILKKSNLQTFNINAFKNSKILDNTIYFPGWRVDIDGKKANIEFQDMNHRGLITFDVSQGKHKAKIKFDESSIRLASDIISAVASLLLIFMFVFRKRVDLLFQNL